MPALLYGLVGAAAAALLALVANQRLERLKVSLAHERTTDERLFDAGRSFAEIARRLWSLSYKQQPSAEDARRLDQLQEDLRAEYPRLRLVGSAAVQEEARKIIHHAHSAREFALSRTDPRADAYAANPDARDPRARLGGHIVLFLTAMREQLGTPDPLAVPSLDAELVAATRPAG